VGVVFNEMVMASEATAEGFMLASTAKASTVVVDETVSGAEYFVEEVVGVEPSKV
jgi:hypothetical protein